MSVRDDVRKVVDEWDTFYETRMSVAAKERLIQTLMEAIDEWADGVERAHRELRRELTSAISDYSSQPEIGFMTIKWLLKGGKK